MTTESSGVIEPIEALYIGTVRAFDSLSRALGVLATLVGLAAALAHASAGRTLSHYDARAHLVVARRLFDNLTPSWEQIGAVWLPLPHVINALPAQIDVFYRTGAFAVAVSILAFAVTAAALAALVGRLTRSAAGSALAVALLASNPNLLYLQSTPMTEPLLFACAVLVTLMLTSWVTADAPGAPRGTGWVMAAAWLTRYEAWPVVASALVLAAWAKWRRGTPWNVVGRELRRLAVYPFGALVCFLLLGRITTGAWFVTAGFYVPEPELQGKPLAVLTRILDGVAELGGSRLLVATSGAAVGLAVAAVRSRSEGALAVPLALVGSAALPFYAYWSGHPYRVRYEVPLLVASAALVGIGVGRLRRAAPTVASLIVVAVLTEVSPLDTAAPMIRESQLDRPMSEGRRRVTACLQRNYDGTTIMASMGSLAHYMQELASAGFRLSDFLHEGNGPLWTSALARGPAPLAGWLLIEEVAEGGDVLYRRQHEWPQFVAGYDRVCEGGNVALYRRR
jgi:hypothetical protein